MQVMEIANARPCDTGKTREGNVDDRVLLEGEEGAPHNYRFLLEEAISDWTTPRHRHDFDQLRVPLRGDQPYTPDKMLKVGSVGYFPAGVHYGPQVKPAGSLLINFQFGGPNGKGYSSNRQKKAAYEEMVKRGKFEAGVYTYVDEHGQRHNQDSAEARRELITGKKEVYKPRYADQVIMWPENFTWAERPESPGVSQKWLGSFTERQLRVGFFKMKRGATVELGMHDSPEVLFLMEGSVTVDGSTFGKHTAFGFVAKEGPVKASAAAETELLCIQLGVF